MTNSKGGDAALPLLAAQPCSKCLCLLQITTTGVVMASLIALPYPGSAREQAAVLNHD